MVSLINQAFKKAKSENRPALLTYTVAGDNTKKSHLKYLNQFLTTQMFVNWVFLTTLQLLMEVKFKLARIEQLKMELKSMTFFQLPKTLKNQKKLNQLS